MHHSGNRTEGDAGKAADGWGRGANGGLGGLNAQKTYGSEAAQG